jgi:hypothetical protein
LRLPDDMNPHAEIRKDGRSFATSGVKGQWSGTPSCLVPDSKETQLEGWI